VLPTLPEIFLPQPTTKVLLLEKKILPQETLKNMTNTLTVAIQHLKIISSFEKNMKKHSNNIFFLNSRSF
jgi:hypothetical protein